MLELIAAGVAGLLLGAAGCYVLGVLTGRLPIWFGPERPGWSRDGWDSAERRLLDSWAAEGYELVQAAPPCRNWLGPNQPRRVTRQYAWHQPSRTGRALVRYGADTEGPPRAVHGGCTATVVDAFMGWVAYRAARKYIVTANLSVNYRKLVPAGSTVCVEASVERVEGRRSWLSFEVRSLDGAVRHNDGTALFIDTQGVRAEGEPSWSQAPSARKCTAHR